MDILTALHFRGLNRCGHRLQGGINIHHHPFPQPRRGTYPNPGNLKDTVFIALTDYRADLCRADIEADN
jgi:hypothetical protein